MLPKKKRVGGKLFKETMIAGRSIHSPYFSLKALRSAPGNVSRISIVVPKKTLNKAVMRNRLRRKISGRLESLKNKFPPGWNVIIFTKPPAIDLSGENIKDELTSLLIKAGLL